MTHDELIEVGRKWLLKPWRNAASEGHSACSLVITDMTTYAWETPDVLGWNSDRSILIECKASRSDFKADAKKGVRMNPAQGVGTQRYYMVPKGLLKLEEVPEGWGLVEVNEAGRTRVRRASKTFVANRQGEVIMLLSLIRRLDVKPGKHMAIRVYTTQSKGEPRASVTFNSEEEESTKWKTK